MTATSAPMAARLRFYGSLEAGLVAWVAMMVAVALTFRLAGLQFVVPTMLGMLAILGGAMRHPAYRRLNGIG